MKFFYHIHIRMKSNIIQHFLVTQFFLSLFLDCSIPSNKNLNRNFAFIFRQIKWNHLYSWPPYLVFLQQSHFAKYLPAIRHFFVRYSVSYSLIRPLFHSLWTESRPGGIGSTLSIANTTSSDAGNYTCTLDKYSASTIIHFMNGIFQLFYPIILFHHV